MKALVANSLTTGEVVFWNKGRWVERFADAELFDDGAADAATAAEAAAKSQATVVVDAYLIDLKDADGIWVPVSYRERIRALGPTNIPEHGKQAEGGEVIEALAHASGAARSSGRLDLIRRK